MAMAKSELKAIRRELSFTQKQMALLLDIKLSAYKDYERGKVTIPDELKVKVLNLLSRRNEHQFEVSFDWLKVRFKTLDYVNVIKKVLQLSTKQLTDSMSSFYGYEDMLTFGNIRILFNQSKEKIEEGVLLEFTGEACREFEKVLLQQKRTWRDFIGDCFEFAETNRGEVELVEFLAFTRVDIAVDELYDEENGNIDLLDLRDRVIEGLVEVKSIKKIRFDQNMERIKGVWKNCGQTLYFGSRQSRMLIRFYQKDYEQSVKRDVSVEYVRKVLGYKNRYEIELHTELSFQVLRDYVWNVELGELASRILTEVFTVYDWDGYLDKRWQELIGYYGGYKFTIQPKDFDYVRSKKWIEKSAASTLLTMSVESYLTGNDLLSNIVSQAVPNENNEKVIRHLAKKHNLSYEEVMGRVQKVQS